MSRLACCGLLAVLGVLWVAGGVACATQGPDIIPAPKKLVRLGEPVALGADAAIVIGAEADPKVRLGIEEINRALRSLGVPPLPIARAGALPAACRVLIAVGVRDREPWLQEWAGPLTETPPKGQGYTIAFRSVGTREVALVCGADPQGALYGCITLAALLHKDQTNRISLQRYHVWDEPDFALRGVSGLRLEYYARHTDAKRLVDFALRHKLNLIESGYADYEADTDLQHDQAWFRDINDYARQRGIRIWYGGWWNVGRAPIPPGLGEGLRYEALGGLIGHRGMSFSWGRDDLLAAKCEQLKHFIRELHPGALYFHPIDTGGTSDPELWSLRDGATRRKFDDDRAAADAHVVNALYEAARAADPDLMFITVLNPYHASDLATPGMAEWLSRVSGLLPPDVYVCQREDSRANVEKWKRLCPQPTFFYFQTEERDWSYRRPFISSFRLMRTFHLQGRPDAVWYTAGGPYGAVEVLGAAEYSWNSTAPGSAVITDMHQPPFWRQVTEYPDAVKGDFLGRACRILFGPAAPAMAQVFASNLSPQLMADAPAWASRDYCERQLADARSAEELLARVERQIPPESVAIYEAARVHATACRYLAAARLKLLAGAGSAEVLAEVDRGAQRLGLLPAAGLYGLNYQLCREAIVKAVEERDARRKRSVGVLTFMAVALVAGRRALCLAVPPPDRRDPPR